MEAHSSKEAQEAKLSLTLNPARTYQLARAREAAVSLILTFGQNIFIVATAQECDFPLVKLEAAFPLLRLGGITMCTALMPGEAGLAGVAAPEAKLCNRMASWSIIAGHWSNQVQLRYHLETTLGRCGHSSNLFNALHEVIPKGPHCIETNNKS
jgi:hypothetical protein